MKKKMGLIFAVVVTVVFLVCLKCCDFNKGSIHSSQTEILEKKEKEVMMDVSIFYELLERADICSSKWIKDAKEVSKQMSESCTEYEQLDIKDSEREKVVTIKETIHALNDFLALQNNQTIEVLEEKSNTMQIGIGDTTNEQKAD